MDWTGPAANALFSTAVAVGGIVLVGRSRRRRLAWLSADPEARRDELARLAPAAVVAPAAWAFRRTEDICDLFAGGLAEDSEEYDRAQGEYFKAIAAASAAMRRASRG